MRRIVLQTFFVSLVVIATVSPACFAQGRVSAALIVHRDDGVTRQYRAFPQKSVKLLFPLGEAFLNGDAGHANWYSAAGFPAKNLELVILRDEQRRFTVAGAISGGKLFIFDELLCDENLGVMNQLIRSAGISSRTPPEALGLAKLYLSLSYFKLADPARFIATNVADVRRPMTDPPLEHVLHVPSAEPLGPGYRVEMFSNNLNELWVQRWEMKIDPAGVHDVKDQIIYPDYELRENFYSQVKNRKEQKGQRKIEFLEVIEANGTTKDGAATDLQTWIASDGPGVIRMHYYYNSHDQADSLMESFLQDAVAVVETGPWLDSKDKIAGKKALIIRANGDTKSLSAMRLFEEKASLLTFSSTCIRNLRK